MCVFSSGHVSTKLAPRAFRQTFLHRILSFTPLARRSRRTRRRRQGNWDERFRNKHTCTCLLCIGLVILVTLSFFYFRVLCPSSTQVSDYPLLALTITRGGKSRVLLCCELENCLLLRRQISVVVGSPRTSSGGVLRAWTRHNRVLPYGLLASLTDVARTPPAS